MKLSSLNGLILSVALCGIACSPQFSPGLVDFEDGIPPEFTSSCQDSTLSIDLNYLGYSYLYFIFEVTIENHGGDTMYIDRSDWGMDVFDGKVMQPFEVDALVALLEKDKKELRKEKKRRTIFSAILAGLEIVATAGQTNVASTLLYGSESALYIFEDRSYIQRDINSVEDEINYIYELALDSEILPPHSSITRDLLFPLQPIKSDLDIVYTVDRREIRCYFSERIF